MEPRGAGGELECRPLQAPHSPLGLYFTNVLYLPPSLSGSLFFSRSLLIFLSSNNTLKLQRRRISAFLNITQNHEGRTAMTYIMHDYYNNNKIAIHYLHHTNIFFV